MIRIVNAEPLGYAPEARDVLAKLGDVTEGPFTRDELLARVGEADVLVVRLAHQIDREVLEAARRLRAIVSATTGVDHIDVAGAEARGIAVLTLRGETEFLTTISASAEHTWALLLALTRRVPAAYASVRAGEWERDRFRGHDLDGRRLGLVGLGRIGTKVARYGLAFGMQVRAFDPYVATAAAGVDLAGTLVDLLARSDVLSLHVPLNASTVGLIGAGELARMPEGALLVNTSRGEVVDEDALVGALESGRLAGAAVDVIADERGARRAASPLLRYAARHDTLLVTPHVAGATVESMHRTEVFMARKLAAFVAREGA